MRLEQLLHPGHFLTICLRNSTTKHAINSIQGNIIMRLEQLLHPGHFLTICLRNSTTKHAINSIQGNIIMRLEQLLNQFKLFSEFNQMLIKQL